MLLYLGTMSDKIYSFEEQLAKGKEWEKKLSISIQKTMGEGYKVVYLPDHAEFYPEGFDMAVYCKTTETTMLLEVKTDFQAHKTGNAFLETISVCRGGKMEKAGWMETSKADAVVYIIPELKRGVFIKMDDLRDILKDAPIPYPFKECRNNTYSSYGFLVPIKKLMEVGSIFSIGE